MMSRPLSVVRRHPIITFFVLTFALSWWPWPLYAMGVSWATGPLLPGPVLAALIVIPITQGWAGLRELGSRMIRWRVRWYWYAAALGIPLTAAAVAWALNVALGAPAPSLATLPPLTAIVMVFGIKLIHPLNGPMGEEPGFRGFALPGLQGSGRSPLVATLILAPLVALWHVPLVFAHEIPPVGLLGPIAFAFAATWVFNHTGGSVFMTLVMHAAEGTLGMLAGAVFVSAALAQLSWVGVAVWFVVVIGLVIFDWKFWRGPATVRATTVAPVPQVVSQAPKPA
jgi:uncharacterized protein